MASRALPDLVARVRLDSSGVDAGLQNMIGSFGKANLAMAGVAAGLGVLIVGGKSMIEISEKHAAAELNLKQAIDSRKVAMDPIPENTAKVTAATDRLHAATRRLSEFDVSHKGHKLAAIDLMHRQDILAQVTTAQEKLAEVTTKASATTVQYTIDSQTLNYQIEEFLKTNRRYLSNQAEVITGAATLVRSGLSQKEVNRDLSIATDIAAIKHISFADAIDLVDKAEHGRMRGLIDLGIVTKDQTDADGNLIKGTAAVGAAMDSLEKKTKGGRDTLTSLQKSTNTLSNDWQDLSNKGGPVLLVLLDKVVTGITAVYDWFDKIGHDDKLWATISDRLVKIAQWIRDYMIVPIGNFFDMVGTGLNNVENFLGGGSNAQGTVRGHRAGGGPVLPNSMYMVGERGPEMFVPNSAGSIVPNDKLGGPQINVYVTSTADPYDIANEVGWQLRKLRRF